MAADPTLPPPRPRLGGPGPALLALAGFLVALAIFAGALFMFNSKAKLDGKATPLPSAGPSQLPKSARFAAQGDCVLNKGSDDKPDMIMVTCAPDAYEVLERIEGTTNVAECEKVEGYRFHYFYDSELGDKFDFVLCLRKRPG